MKESKFIKESTHKIEDFTISVSKAIKVNKNEHPLVVQESEERFLIVDEFSDGAKAGTAISKKNLDPTLFNKTVDGEVLYYAEEVFDSEDELYQTEIHDKEIEKERHRTYKEIADELDDVMTSHGYRGKIWFNLLASMRFSRFISVENHQDIENQINALSFAIGNPICTIEFTKEIENIAYDEMLFKILAFAKNHSNKPVFVLIKNLDGKEAFNFLRPIYPYIDSPLSDNIIAAEGRSMYIPHNVWFIYTLRDGDMPSRVSRRLLRYSSTVNFELSKCPIETHKVSTISLEEIDASFKEACEEFFINEDAWKQIDHFVSIINKVSGYALQNKIARSLEDYMIILKVFGFSDDEVLDISLANNFIREAIITTNPLRYVEEVPIDDAFTNAFGEDKMPRCRKIVDEYVSHFKAGGKLEHE